MRENAKYNIVMTLIAIDMVYCAYQFIKLSRKKVKHDAT